MACLDHWNAVFLSRKLKRKPVSVRIDGRDFALFRAADGKLGALDDLCPHRRMRLSAGCVVGEKLQCAYHGWTFDCAGNGESPATPKLHARMASFDIREAYGLVWLKPRDCNAEFPEVEQRDYYHLCSMEHIAPVPLEVSLDNFCEVEHTAMVHMMFGYELDRMAEVKIDVQSDDREVRCVSDGPHKSIPTPMRWGMGVGKQMAFHSEWYTRFSPLHLCVEHTVFDADTGKPAKLKYRAYVFLTPIDAASTKIYTVVFMKSGYPGPYGGIRLAAPWLRRMAKVEIDHDIVALAKLADTRPGLEGLKLSRFDHVMGLNRSRINRIYRGLETEK
ncbi:MAG: Rieske 2Fe-2S domain-containing protein [Planctomycetia bacterium]|nr:Rieske 2Fe-2S domain-containing protein [Planctomycetia bacterium]